MLTAGLIIGTAASAQTACSELFFSEYIEGSSGNNKVLEIYNPTNATVNLADYNVKLYANGSATPNNTLVLTGTLAAHDVLVIVHPQAVAALLALADIVAPSTAGQNPTNFNGDDAVGLYKTVGTNETLVDLIGNIGCDPGSSWDAPTGTASTANRNIRRKATVTGGVTVDPADTPCDFPTIGTEWDDFVDTDYTNLGMHTATPCAGTPTNQVVGFATPTATVNEAAGTVTVTINITNPSTTAATSVDVALGTGGTATATSDFTFTGSTLTWAAGDNAAKTVTITVIDDAVLENDETVELVLSNPTGGATIGTATYTLTIEDNEVRPIPNYTVAQVTNNHPTTFIADSLGVTASLTGTLYGVNQRTSGLQLTLIDATGGIGLFRNSITLPAQGWPATMPVEGDSVRVWGTVGQFNGLTQLEVDSIEVLMPNHMLRQPMVINGPLGENTESELITIANPVSLVTPAQWTNTGSGFNVDVTDGTNTYAMRIVATSDIFGTPAPTGIFVLTGIGGQFDSSNPHDSGYQIIPRRLTDLRIVTGLTKGQLEAVISVYPNPVREVLHLNVEAKNATVTIVNALGQEVATVPASAKTVNVANLPAGVYMLKVSAANTVAVKRFVKIN
ncbi:MAG TPA: Calx-beta domain-containing protein [Adhaeribacter sp.]|nr:Calx-beta domain-containing protein [Adhaeribacter sp.]